MERASHVTNGLKGPLAADSSLSGVATETWSSLQHMTFKENAPNQDRGVPAGHVLQGPPAPPTVSMTHDTQLHTFGTKEAQHRLSLDDAVHVMWPIRQANQSTMSLSHVQRTRSLNTVQRPREHPTVTSRSRESDCWETLSKISKGLKRLVK